MKTTKALGAWACAAAIASICVSLAASGATKPDDKDAKSTKLQAPATKAAPAVASKKPADTAKKSAKSRKAAPAKGKKKGVPDDSV